MRSKSPRFFPNQKQECRLLALQHVSLHDVHTHVRTYLS